MDYLLLFIEILTPLLIALFVLWVDRKIRDSQEFDSIIDNLIGELCQNLAIVRTVIPHFDKSINLLKSGGWSFGPSPLLSNVAYNRAVSSEVFFKYMRKSNNGFVRKLMEYYAFQDIVNQQIREINKAKLNCLVNKNASPAIFQLLFERQKKAFNDLAEPTIVSLLSDFTTINKKYNQTIKLYTTQNTLADKLNSVEG